MKDPHDIEIAAKAKERSEKHIEWIFNNRFVDNSLSGFYDKLKSYKPNNGYIDECSQRLYFFIAERHEKRWFFMAH